MKTLLQHRNNQYFDERQDHQFIFFTINPIMKITKIEKHNGNWWLMYPGINTKAISVPCISLEDIGDMHFNVDENDKIRGIIGGGGYGLNNSPYAYIFWGRIYDAKTPSACALFDINKLILRNDTFVQN